ncbi:MAG: YraN family protein, partial [Prevotellaceae bacterium]|nr:YraN family protein [Prevotellaceae bacterium]
MALHNELGRAGENAACQYLIERDYHIVERNWRCHPLEVDIIADDWGELVFVEVKTSSDDRWEDPAAAV